MARLIIWILLSTLLYGGYWFGATRALDGAVTNAVAEARKSGWQIDYDELTTSGFPGGFDVFAGQIDIVAADRTWAWQAPELQVRAPGLRPTQISVILPETQILRLADQTLQIDGDSIVVDARARLNMALSFEHAAINATEAAVQSDVGWRLGSDLAIATLQRADDADRAYDLDLDARGITIPVTLLGQLAQTGVLTNTIDSVVMDAEITLDRALDRFAFGTNDMGPMLERVVLRDFNMRWGEIGLRADGAVDVDANGAPDGRMTFRTAEWETIIDLLVTMGALDQGVAPTLTNMAATMVDENGMLALPVTFRDGFMSMGLLPLGPAPRLH
ncbi:MAG: DUF2125 domain-containing protein [Pseudomonadota bacterium]